ncbi:MAG: GWxTD domain-containing protein [Candidatus Eisenbacteria bacterium]
MLLLLWAAPQATGAELPTLRAEGSPIFSADLSVIRDGEGRPSLVVNVSVPYTELQWVRTARGYSATVEITAALDARRGARGYGGNWQRHLLVPSYASTRSPNATLSERDTLKSPPGRYSLRVGLHDLQADRSSSSTEPVTIEDWSKVPVGFSELELGTADSTGHFLPRAERRFGREIVRLAGRAVLFDRRPGSWPRRYALILRVKDESGTVLLTDERALTASATGEPLILIPSRNDLFVGGYSLEAELVEGRSRWRVSRSFEVEESGPPQGADFERMLEPLGYIAEESVVEALRRLPPNERSAGWEEFWLRRDPTPETARNEALIDFVRRVRYAEQHFQGFGAGWRSDMGKVYIRHGAPDQIETRPATVQSPQIEIWYYHQPYRRIVFVDREGFGRFVWVPSGIE